MRPTLEKILSKVLEIEGMNRSYFEKWRKGRIAPVCHIKHLVCYFGKKYGYTGSQLARFLCCAVASTSAGKKKIEDLMSVYKEDAEKVNLIDRHLASWHANGWVVRSESGMLTVFSDKPERIEEQEGVFSWRGNAVYLIPSTTNVFPQVMCDEGAHECEIVIALK